MEHGVIIGRIVEADEKRLLVADGTEIVAADGLRLPDLSLGTTLMVAYTITDGQKIVQTVTIMPEPGRSVDFRPSRGGC